MNFITGTRTLPSFGLSTIDESYTRTQKFCKILIETKILMKVNCLITPLIEVISYKHLFGEMFVNYVTRTQLYEVITADI